VRTISGLPRGFSTCCLRFTNGVAIIHAKLASSWLAGLYREGVEPSGSRRKVSDSVLILLSWTFPDATKIGSSTSIAAVMQTRSRKVEMPNGLSLPLAFGMNTLLIGSGR